MKVEWSDLAGVVLQSAERHQDERGAFEKLFEAPPPGALAVTQVCTSFNRLSGTVRGLHYQAAPNLERKSLWCGSGELFDVLVDTRSDEPTYGCWAGLHLDASQAQLLQIPPGVAHGYQTLTDGVTVNYLIDGSHSPQSARTIRWDDPTLAIEWPLPLTVISDSDGDGLSWPVS